MKKKPISDETKRTILETAWALISDSGRADVGMAEIAKAAGVSRQTVFYAFGDRTGLLIAMVRHKDTMTDHVDRLTRAAALRDGRPGGLVAMAEAWLDYLPVIYPVGILLDAAALTDPSARAAWEDRMSALRGGFLRLARHIHAESGLPDTPERIADEIWALCHASAWRRLVVDCGWSAEAFRVSRLSLIASLLAPG